MATSFPSRPARIRRMPIITSGMRPGNESIDSCQACGKRYSRNRRRSRKPVQQRARRRRRRSRRHQHRRRTSSNRSIGEGEHEWHSVVYISLSFSKLCSMDVCALWAESVCKHVLRVSRDKLVKSVAGRGGTGVVMIYLTGFETASRD